MPVHPNRSLVMTIGTGNLKQLNLTLFTPSKLSINTEDWARVVLLPSSETENFAVQLKAMVPSAAVEIRPLPKGHENDADMAYAHFDAVLGDIMRDAGPEHIEVDFTRGTKAMSAALVLAATRRGIPRLRYIIGERGSNGNVEGGTEVVKRFRTSTVDEHRRLDLARGLFERGNFAAIAEVLPDPSHPLSKLYSEKLIEISGSLRSVARFYETWDRLDYNAAAATTIDMHYVPEWHHFWPTNTMQSWVHSLSIDIPRTDTGAMASYLRKLVIDLLANAERRITQGQNEDALVRAYRALELIGQARLFDHGLDSGHLDPEHAAVKAVAAKAEKKKDAPFAPKHRSSGALTAARFQVGRLLKQLNDPLASRLLEFDQEALLKPTLRNNSVLVHGFTSTAPDDSDELRNLLQSLAMLAREDGGADFETSLMIARGPAFKST